MHSNNQPNSNLAALIAPFESTLSNSTSSTVYVGFASKVTCATKNTAFKNQLRNFLRDENHLYGIILVHLSSNVVLKTRKRLLAARYRKKNFKSSKLEILSHSLTDHSRKPRAQTKQHTVTILRH